MIHSLESKTGYRLQSICVDCGELMEIRFFLKKSEDLEEIFYICDHCKKNTTCYVLDEIVRDMERDMLTMVGRRERQALQAMINERKSMLKKEIHGSDEHADNQNTFCVYILNQQRSSVLS